MSEFRDSDSEEASAVVLSEVSNTISSCWSVFSKMCPCVRLPFLHEYASSDGCPEHQVRQRRSSMHHRLCLTMLFFLGSGCRQMPTMRHEGSGPKRCSRDEEASCRLFILSQQYHDHEPPLEVYPSQPCCHEHCIDVPTHPRSNTAVV
jgi:hypothetical protein